MMRWVTISGVFDFQKPFAWAFDNANTPKSRWCAALNNTKIERERFDKNSITLLYD